MSDPARDQIIASNRASALRDIRNGVLVGVGFLVFSFVLSLLSSGITVIAALPIIASVVWIVRGVVKLVQNPVTVPSGPTKAPPVDDVDENYEGW